MELGIREWEIELVLGLNIGKRVRPGIVGKQYRKCAFFHREYLKQ